jgi:S-adenosylmethionine:tRNA ribosyltransferase-isomerase
MDLGVLDFALDPTLIAQQPLSTRDGSRMLVLERATGACTHTAVAKLVDWMRPHDVLVVNDAEVIAARLHGKRPTGGNVEVLLVEPVEADGTWQCIARGAGRIPAGETITFGTGLSGVWGERTSEIYRRIRLQSDGDLSAALQRLGELPLPPYIRRPRPSPGP